MDTTGRSWGTMPDVRTRHHGARTGKEGGHFEEDFARVWKPESSMREVRNTASQARMQRENGTRRPNPCRASGRKSDAEQSTSEPVIAWRACRKIPLCHRQGRGRGSTQDTHPLSPHHTRLLPTESTGSHRRRYSHSSTPVSGECVSSAQRIRAGSAQP
eukprot:2976770-Rhodomonas_salina.1